MSSECTIKDIANMAGVSVGTVSRVLNKAGNIEPDLRRRTMDAIKRTKYVHRPRGRRPSSAEEGNATSSSPEGTILVLFPDMNQDWLTHELWENGYMGGVKRACAERGYSPVIHMADQFTNADKDLSGPGKMACGALVKTSSTHFASEITRLAELTPVATFGLYIPTLPLPQAAIDGYGAGIAAAEAMLGAGHRKVAFVNHAARNSMFLDRAQGFASALKREGLFHPEFMIERNDFDDKTSSSPMKNVPDMSWALSELLALDEKPTAVAFVNDWSALGFYKACEAAALPIPDTFSVLGMDDSSYCQIATPQLSSIELPFGEIARLAANMLFDMMEGSGHHLRGQASAHYVPARVHLRQSISRIVT